MVFENTLHPQPPTIYSPGYGDGADDAKSRIKTACVSCRKRKCRCDGSIPCNTCLASNKVCVYPELRSQRRRGKGKTSNKAEIRLISERLRSLESVIGKLSDQLDQKPSRYGPTDGVTNVSVGSETFSSLSEVPSNSDDSDIDKARRTSSDSLTTTDSGRTDIKSGFHAFGFGADNPGFSPSISEKSPLSSPEKLPSGYGHVSTSSDSGSTANSFKEFGGQSDRGDCQFAQQMIGMHTVFSLFSKASLTWLRGRFNNEKLLTPLKNLPLIFDNILKSSTDSWLNPPTRELIDSTGNFGYFPNSAQLVYEILDAHTKEYYFFCHLVNIDQVKHLFSLYYTHNTVSNYERNRHRFKYSELILMNTVLALCLSCRLEADADHNPKFELLNKLSEEDTHSLKEDFFNSAICYYEKVSVMNEGIQTVQCLALVILYVEYHYASDFHLVYMITSVLIRYAQDLSLHKVAPRNRKDNSLKNRLVGMDESLGQRLWRFCEYMDIYTCYRMGKSPLIKMEDVCSFAGEEVDEFKIPISLFSEPGIKRKSSEPYRTDDLNQNVLDASKVIGTAFYHSFYASLLKRIERKSYVMLFSPNAILENRDSTVLFSKIKEINRTMIRMAKIMDPNVRPTLPLPQFQFNDAHRADKSMKKLFQTASASENFPALLTHLSFLCHYMLVNRSVICITADASTNVETSAKYHLDLSVIAAREILNLALSADVVSMPSMLLGWTTFPVFEGFSTLFASCVCRADGECGPPLAPVTTGTLSSEEQLYTDCKLVIEISKKYFCYKQLLPACDNWIAAFKREQKLATYDLIVRILLKLLLTFVASKTGTTFPEYELEEYFKSVELMFPQLFRDDFEQVKSFSSILKDSYNLTPSGYTRLEPTLANIINGVSEDSNSSNSSNSSLLPDTTAAGSPTSFTDETNFAALLYSQTFNLPNFFHDF